MFRIALGRFEFHVIQEGHLGKPSVCCKSKSSCFFCNRLYRKCRQGLVALAVLVIILTSKYIKVLKHFRVINLLKCYLGLLDL